MFGRATITLGIGPHSSFVIVIIVVIIRFALRYCIRRPTCGPFVTAWLSVGLSVTVVSPAKTAEPVKMSFRFRFG